MERKLTYYYLLKRNLPSVNRIYKGRLTNFMISALQYISNSPSYLMLKAKLFNLLKRLF